MKHTIIYFIGVYDTLDLFTGKLREAFETMGYASFVYDARLPQSKDALLSALAESSSPEREFSCVTLIIWDTIWIWRCLRRHRAYGRTMRVYKRVGPEMSGNITASRISTF